MDEELYVFFSFEIPYGENRTRRYFSIIKNSLFSVNESFFTLLNRQPQSDSFDKVQSYGHFVRQINRTSPENMRLLLSKN